jgi:hypothetical protein
VKEKKYILCKNDTLTETEWMQHKIKTRRMPLKLKFQRHSPGLIKNKGFV